MPADGSDHGFKYWAFISYSHADKQWGDWLHRALETYRVPKRLVGTVSASGMRVPARVFPIFRDREELPVSASLPDNINRALEQSRCLIIICSPRAAASRWVNEEIKTFKRLGREDRVLALIVAGEPNASEDGGKPGFRVEDECFPPTLRYRWGTDGELSTERSEPVAADARPDKDGKRNAKLKLLAGLLQVNYDQLRQREQERRARQLGYLAAGALALLAVFAGLAVYSEVQRRRAEQATTVAQEQRRNAEQATATAQEQRQNAETQRRNAELQRQKAEAQEQEATRQRNAALEANRQYKSQLHEASMSDVASAENLVNKGSRLEAIAYLGRALTYDRANHAAAVWLWNQIVYGSGDQDAVAELALRHKDVVTTAVFSPDGALIVTAGADKTAQVWDARTGAAVGAAMRHRLYVSMAAFSPDGARVVTASMDKTAQVWNALTGQPIGAPMQHDDWVTHALFFPDGNRVLTVSNDNTARVWDANTGKALDAPIEGAGSTDAVALSPDGRRFVMVGRVGGAQVWDVALRRRVGRPLVHENGTISVVFSADGRRVLTGGQDNAARVWDAETGQPTGVVLHHKGLIWNAVFSSDGTRIATASDDRTAQVWDATTGEPIGEAMPHPGTVFGVAFSRDGRWVATACRRGHGGQAQVWDAVTGKPASGVLPNDGDTTKVEFSPNSRRLLSASKDGTARVWRFGDSKRLPTVLRGEDRSSLVAVSAGGKRIAAVLDYGKVQVWNWETRTVAGQIIENGSEVQGIAFSPDGTLLATATENAGARIWNASTGKPAGTGLDTGYTCHSVAFSPDGRRIVTGVSKSTLAKEGEDAMAGKHTGGELRIWDVTTRKMVGQPIPTEKPVCTAVFSPDGRRVLVACASLAQKASVQQYDPETGQPIGAALDTGYFISGTAAYSPDGKRIVTTSYDRTARLWDAASGAPLGAVMMHDGEVYHAMFNTDGTRVVTAAQTSSATSEVREWDGFTGRPVSEPFRSEQIPPDAVYFPDGAHLVVAAGERELRVWDVAPAELPEPPAWLDDFVSAVTGYSFAADTEALKILPMAERMACRTRVEAALRSGTGGGKGGQWEDIAREALGM